MLFPEVLLLVGYPSEEEKMSAMTTSSTKKLLHSLSASIGVKKVCGQCCLERSDLSPHPTVMEIVSASRGILNTERIDQITFTLRYNRYFVFV